MIGHNFITVVWNQATSVNEILLTVLKRNPSNNWDTLYITNIINESSYTVRELDLTKVHRIEFRSICQDGGASTLFASIDPPVGLILELTANGRTPINPQPANCSSLNYMNNEWVGFKLSKTEGNSVTSSFFEFEKITDPLVEGKINRVYTERNESESLLVAANELGDWPENSNNSIYTGGVLFQIAEITPQGIFKKFGQIEFESHLFNGTVSICSTQTVIYPYAFQAYVASKVVCPTCPTQGGQVGGQGRITNNFQAPLIRVINPISEYLHVLFSSSAIRDELYHITLSDMNGKIHFEERIEVQTGEIAIQIGSITPGSYILHIGSNTINQNLKVIKI